MPSTPVCGRQQYDIDVFFNICLRQCCRERESGVYGTNAYFLATVAFDLIPLRVAPPAFFALFSYWAIGLHAGCATCVLAFLCEFRCSHLSRPHHLLRRACCAACKIA